MKTLFTTLIFFLILTSLACQSTDKKSGKSSSYKHSYGKTEPIPKDSSGLITDVQQFTFAGKRTGEGYFNNDGTLFVVQSEREEKNPFYQIYLKDLKNGETTRISPGFGKTTCSWVHPNNKKVMYSSTHRDPQARKKMKEVIEFRKSGKKKRYSWDYDETYEIFETQIDSKVTRQLSFAKGYDAEGSYSPNGKKIAFASNRHAYSSKLTETEKALLKKDPSVFLDIYIMDSTGKNVKRLTKGMGYDGGPFFSPDGKRITWRKFDESGHVAEVYTMNLDGSDKKQITKLNKMSWAPYYHPSGDYIVFTTNRHGYRNFEIYIVDTEGLREPVRVSFMPDFDGLPVFTPDGQELTWTRRSQGQSQIFKAKWNDLQARKLLKLKSTAPKANELNPKITTKDIERSLNYFASPQLKGRRAGSPEEIEYTQTLVDLFKGFNLKPGFNNSFTHNFKFPSGAELGPNNFLKFSSTGADPIEESHLKLDKTWRPLSFSASGSFKPSSLVFAGYGLNTPSTDKFKAYDSYGDLDVKGKWVMMFRYIPEDIKDDLRVHFNRYSKLQHKVMIARERGAAGVVFVSGPQSNAKSDLIRFNKDESSGQTSIPAISISDKLAQRLLDSEDKSLKKLQKKLDLGKEKFTLEFKKMKLSTSLNVKHNTAEGRNVLAMLRVPGAKKTIVIGAHGDHLGEGRSSSSLMRSKDRGAIHYGADDNASGMSSIVELAHYYSQKENQKGLKKNILFAIWSAEEIGVLGSKAFLESYKKKYKKTYPRLSAYLNLDMVGRYKDGLAVQGIGSSKEWKDIIEKTVVGGLNLNLVLNDDPYVPTDGMPFYMAGIPSLTLFTGAHTEYHTPRDTPDLIDYEKTKEITHYVRDVSRLLASRYSAVKYERVKRAQSKGSGRRGFRIYLGTIPDYSKNKVKGLKLSGVIKGGPAEKAGLKGGDVIVKFGNRNIENIHDYVYSLEAARPNKKISVEVLREGQLTKLEIVPMAKE